MTQPTTEQQIAVARQAARTAQENRVRAEATRDQAIAAEAQITEALKAEFGVQTLDEAGVLLSQIETQLQAELAAVGTHIRQVMP